VQKFVHDFLRLRYRPEMGPGLSQIPADASGYTEADWIEYGKFILSQ
jgi:hypothetical protein